ncbi:phthiocerol/phthiodiolone dimycocerosyl transferase family protein [Antrihabitans stalactiti]|uniref:Phthiocerol/phthiodiolone dimycocerosyl transferase n=1 Tax=Antrihabitans stalactiti TaxID=2584121 RepID=A0A848KRB0_9NOCA|nr:short-chain dehydrogenase [Antrihabitans stalactiti]NMN98820.1 short-chain dehydrogenase [Antrihabitans stalactiti]
MSEIRRELSPVERWYWVADQVSPLNVIARVHVRGPLSDELLVDAAARLAAEQPLLRVSIAADTDGTRPRFVAPAQPTIPVRSVVEADAWEREVDSVELSTSLDWRTGPLVRILHVSADDSHDIVLTASHIIADGTTVLVLLQRLLELAAGAELAPRNPLPAPEELLPKGFRGPRGGLRIVGGGVADQVTVAVARPARLQPEVAVDAARRRTRLIRHRIDGDVLAALVDTCRAKGVTVHGALTAAMASAIGQEIDPGGSGRLCIGSPIDFRGELEPPVPKDDAGAYVATVPSHLQYGESVDLWDCGRSLNTELERRKRFRQHLVLLATLRLICPKSVSSSGRSFALAESKGPGNVCISNIGRFDFAGRIGEWELSGAQFIAGISISGFYVATVNTSHGVLHWNFTYIDECVSRERANRIADGAVRTLLAGIE